jgi:hypothetical protein
MCGKITITLTRKWDFHTINYIYIFRNYSFTTGANIRGDLNFNRVIFYDTCKEVMIADEGIEVLGTMGSGRTPEVNITVRSKFQ